MKDRACLAVLLCFSLVFCQSGFAQSPIVADGKTQTTVTVNGNVTGVTTNTVRGSNAFNSFTVFNVQHGTTTNLYVPENAKTLFNLVNGEKTTIDGILNSIKDGKIGGRIFFLNPYGVVVGSTGVINVGSLTLVTPSRDFNNSFFDNEGNVSDTATTAALTGNIPLSSDGLILVRGRINALTDIRLAAGKIENSGTIGTGAVFVANSPDFSDVVNVKGLQAGSQIAASNGNIEILADTAFENSGTISATGVAGTNGGNISITAPQITLADNSQVLADARAGYQAGDVTLTASATNESANADANAGITIGKSVLTGRNITLSASATAKADSAVDSQLPIALDDISLGFQLTGSASAETSKSTASINIANASITASGNVSVNAESSSSAKVATSDSSIGISYGKSDATATISIGSGSTIKAAGTFDAKAKVDNELEVSASSSDGSGLAAAVAYGKATSTSTVQVDGSVTASSVSAASDIENSFSTEAKGKQTAQTGGGSGAGVGVALAFYNSTATNNVSGSLSADAGDVTVTATSTNTKNSTKSESEVSDGDDKQKLAKEELSNLDKFLGDSSKQKNQPKAESNSSAFGLAGAVSYTSSSNAATTNVTGTVTAPKGDIKATSTATDSPSISAAGSASGSNVSLGGSLALGNFSNTATTKISDNAVLTAKGVEVSANAEFTNPVLDPVKTIVKDFDFTGIDFTKAVSDWASALWNDATGFYDGVKALKSDLEDPTVFTTSYTNTGLSASDKGSNTVGIAGSVDLITLTNNATASIEGKAKVTANTGNVDVKATADATMINASGMAFTKDQLKDRNPGVSADSALGGSYLGSNLTNGSKAFIGDGTVVTASAGNVNVNATTDSLAINIFQSGDKAEKFGVAGSFNSGKVDDSSEAYIQSNATVSAGKDVDVTATNTLKDFSVGGALGLGGTVQVGVTIAWNDATQTTLAYIGDPTNSRTSICTGCGVSAGGSVDVNAQSKESLYAISFAAAASGLGGKGANGESATEPTGKDAPKNSGDSAADKDGKKQGDNGAGGGKYGFGISGDIAFNNLTTSSGGPGVVTKAFINNGASVNSPLGDVKVTAQDSSFIVAAGVALALGKQAALAGAYGQNTFSKQIEAFTANSNLTAKGLNVAASSDSDLYNVTAGGSVNTQPGIALAGSVNNNDVTNNTSAYIGDDTVATIGADGTSVTASQTGTVVSVAGALGLAISGAGIGAAVDIGDYKNTISARIDKAKLTSTGNVLVTSNNDETLWPVAASAAVGSKFGADGSVDYERVTNNTTAAANGTVSTNANLVVASNDKTNVTNIAGGLGIGGTAAISIAAIIPSVSRTTTATIGSQADVTALGSSSAPLTYQNSDVVGTLVQATSNGELSDYAISGGIAGTIAASGAVIVNPLSASQPDTLHVDTEATIAAGAKVNNKNDGADSEQSVSVVAKDSTTIKDIAGALSVSGYGAVGVGYDQIQPNWTAKASIGKGATVNAAANVIVNSDLSNKVDSYAIAVSGSSVAIAGAATRIDETSTSSASIDGTVNAQGSVLVDANRKAELNPLDGNGALGIADGFGGSLSMNTANDTVEASVGPNANITALGKGSAISVSTGEFDENGDVKPKVSFHGLAVSATNSLSVTPMAVGASVAGSLAADGSVIINTLTENTSAEIKGGAVVNSTNTGAADSQSVAVLAADTTNINNLAGAASISLGLGIGAAVDSGNIKKSTTAGIGNGASVTAEGAVTVKALSTETIRSITAAIGGALKVGIAGAAADYSTNPISPTTKAYIGSCTSATGCTGGAIVSAGSVSVEANDHLSLDTTAGAVGAGGVGLGAGVLVIKNDASTTAYVGAKSNVTSNDGETDVRAISSANLTATALAGSAGLVAGNATSVTLQDNSSSSAFVGDSAVVTSKGDINVTAENTRTINAKTAGLSAGVVAGGASLANATLNGGATAYIDNATVASNNGALNITAELTDSQTATAIGIAAGVGVVADAKPSVTNKAKTEAYVAGSSQLTSKGNTTIAANAVRTLTANSGSATVGGAAVGLSFAEITLGGSTHAFVDGGTEIGSAKDVVGGLTLRAHETDDVSATATPLAGGAAAGVGGETSVTVKPDVAASLTGVNVHSSGDVSIIASHTSTVKSNVASKALGAFTAGGATAAASLTPTVSTSITGGTIDSKNIAVGAAADETLEVTSLSSSSDLAFASGMSISATGESKPTVTTTVGGGASLTASDDITVAANSKSDLKSVKSDGALANLSAGSGGKANAVATIVNTTSATIGSATLTSNARGVSVAASSDNLIAGVDSTTRSGSGIVNVGGATTSASITDNVTTTLQKDASLQASSGNVVVASTGQENVVASASNPNGLSGVAQSEATTGVTIAANVNTKVQKGARVDGRDTRITAEIAKLRAVPETNASSSDASARGVLGVGAYATSNLITKANTTVEIENGAAVSGTNSLQLDSTIGGVELTNTAHSDAKAGIVPISEATANSNATLAANVAVDHGSTLATNSLTINAIKPTGDVYSNWASASYTFYAIFGIPISGTGTQNVSGGFAANNLISVNGTLQQAFNVPSLLINADGTYSGPLAVAGEDANNILLSNASGIDAMPHIAFNAVGGKVEGTLQVSPNLLLINNSDRNLILQNVAAQGSSYTDSVVAAHTAVGSMPITIQNNGAANVIFAGKVSDVGGSLDVSNQGGSIYGATGNSIQVNSATLSAPHGAIGSTGGSTTCLFAGCPAPIIELAPLNLFLTPTVEVLTGALLPGQLSAVARNDINLNLTPDGTPLQGASSASSVPLRLDKIVAGGDINLVLNPGIVSVAGVTKQVNSDYQIRSGDWIGAGGTFNAQLKGSESAKPTLTVDGTLTSGFDNISVTANADGSFTSLVSAAGAGSAELNYVQSAGSAVQVSDIDTSHTGINISGTGNLQGSGTVALLNGPSNITIANHSDRALTTNSITNNNAAAHANISLTGTTSISPTAFGSGAGLINISSDSSSVNLLGLINNPSGAVSVSSGADITGPSSTTLIRSKDIRLTAGGNIGPNLGIEMTQPTGVLDASANGSIALSASSGDLTVGTVSSRNGDITITSSGSILSAATSFQPNLSGRNITLTSKSGSVGSSDRWLSTMGTGILNAVAGSDIYLRQIAGDLSSEDMVSRGGSINLVIDNGNGYFQNVNAARNALLLVNGNVLNVSKIDADKIRIALAGVDGGATIDNMLVGSSVDLTADHSQVLDLVHTSLTPLRLDIGPNDGSPNKRPPDAGAVLVNTLQNADRRNRDERVTEPAEPATNLVIDTTAGVPDSGETK